MILKWARKSAHAVDGQTLFDWLCRCGYDWIEKICNVKCADGYKRMHLYDVHMHIYLCFHVIALFLIWCFVGSENSGLNQLNFCNWHLMISLVQNEAMPQDLHCNAVLAIKEL